jgi:hypothetical protein
MVQVLNGIMTGTSGNAGTRKDLRRLGNKS